ncbi:TadE/TadG family type IV pilus assembly protein [Roseococcus sp.]|uniref:TadE/TadG family type IV pilus assembly protein n=1 Tax=Roseococcus sp. TaxID=2109646 RepID=UPI003BA8B611
MAVEFALTATVLILLVFSIIAFGIQFGARIVAAQAASEGARAAVAGLTTAERQSLALTAATNMLNSYGGLARIRTVTATPIGTTQVDVRVTLDITAFGLTFPGLPLLPTNPGATVRVQVGGF